MALLEADFCSTHFGKHCDGFFSGIYQRKNIKIIINVTKPLKKGLNHDCRRI